MNNHSIAEPAAEAAVVLDRRLEVRVAFLGRLDGLSTRPSTGEAAREAFSAKCDRRPVHVAVNRQVHSHRIVTPQEAPAEADGLFDDSDPAHGVPSFEAGSRPPSVLAIFTADCVPVLLGSPGGAIVALHAGWRGLAAGIINHGVARFAEPEQVTAWVGPSIGACCYEVNDEVALDVARTCDASVIRPGHGDRPHLDLERASRLQLQAGGVRDVRVIHCCTRCDPMWHSYRREGPGQGRNHAFIWRDAGAESPRTA